MSAPDAHSHEPAEPTRRPMAFRHQRWARALAQRLGAAGVTPSAVSLTSIAFSLLAAAALVISARLPAGAAAVLLVAAPVLVALRGICNLIDGMIAVEGGRRTASGEVFNDFPDRVSDVALFVAAGYAAHDATWGVPLGWLAAVLAVATAYTRMLGGALGARQPFCGPMAKPARMAVLSAASVAATAERLLVGTSWSLVGGLGLIVLGCMVTVARRLARIVRELEHR